MGRASSKGLDFSQMMDYARKTGGPALRKMTFQERGLMLKKLWTSSTFDKRKNFIQ